MPWEPVIGLEIHAQLRTRTKLFCGCQAAVGAPPNSRTCPVCLGLPGALPALNGEAVEAGIRAALALGCRVARVSVFARKNYFYPDLPKGYQITQYDQPLATGGHLEWTIGGRTERVGITRVHLEEDAGKSLHDRAAGAGLTTALDFNRSGVPLIEIVTAPDIRAPEVGAALFQRLRTLLVSIGVNDGNMEEGNLRCDANVSIRVSGTAALGTRTEIKNLNSFRFLRRALAWEVARQIAVVDRGEAVTAETRFWDPAAGVTVPMRTKEEAEDYRYFPEPDLPPLVVSPERLATALRALPELPEARAARYRASYGLPEADAAFLAQSPVLAAYFEATAAEVHDPRVAAHWIIGDLTRKMHETGDELEQVRVRPAALAGLIRLVEDGSISGPTAKAVFEDMYVSGRPAPDIVRERGLGQISDLAALEVVVRDVLRAHAGAAADYRAGKRLAFGFLVGQVMKATGGRASPRMVTDLLRRELGGAE